MKKKLIIWLCVILAIVLFFLLRHKHTYEEGWTFDSKTHWHAATCGDDVKGEEERHDWVFTETILEPTFDDQGIDLYTCRVCGCTKEEKTPRQHRQVDIEKTVWRSEELRTYSDSNHKQFSGYMYFKFYSTKYYITISDGKKTYTYDEGNWERISGDTFKTWWDGGKYPDYYEITVKETPNGETYHFKDPIDGGYFEFWSHMD